MLVCVVEQLAFSNWNYKVSARAAMSVYYFRAWQQLISINRHCYDLAQMSKPSSKC